MSIRTLFFASALAAAAGGPALCATYTVTLEAEANISAMGKAVIDATGLPTSFPIEIRLTLTDPENSSSSPKLGVFETDDFSVAFGSQKRADKGGPAGSEFVVGANYPVKGSDLMFVGVAVPPGAGEGEGWGSISLSTLRLEFAPGTFSDLETPPVGSQFLAALNGATLELYAGTGASVVSGETRDVTVKRLSVTSAP